MNFSFGKIQCRLVYKKLDGKIMFEEILQKSANDFKTSILKAKYEDIDFLFAPISEHPVTFFKQARSLKFKKPILSSDQISQEFINAGNGALENLYFSNADIAKNKYIKLLEKKYKKFYNENPSNIYYVALAYDALNFALKAYSKKGSTSFKDSILSLDNFNGVISPIKINKNGSFKREEVIYKVKNNTALKIK